MTVPAAPVATPLRQPFNDRDEIEAALVFDRNATASLHRADRRLAAAATTLAVHVDQDWSKFDIRMAQRGVDVATDARFRAADYQSRCRTALTTLLDRIVVASRPRDAADVTSIRKS
jgi:hypothetical protein